MSGFFKSKFFYIVAVLTLIAVIVPTVLCSMGLTPVLRSAVNTVLMPVQKLSDKAAGAIEGFTSYFTAFDRLKEENVRLKEEIASLREEVAGAREIKAKYDWMSDFLELKMLHHEYNLVPAVISGRGSANYSNVFMLDAGKLSGIQRGMPVVSGDGILGYIAEVGPTWSKAVSVMEASSSVGAYVERSGAIGVVEAEYDLSLEGILKMSYLDEDADIKVGDRILTSGYGSVYPRSLVIGYVETVKTDDLTRSITATVRPASTLDQVSKVMVVTEYEVYAEEP